MKKVFEEEGDQESLSILPKAVDTVRKKVIFCKLTFGSMLLFLFAFVLAYPVLENLT